MAPFFKFHADMDSSSYKISEGKTFSDLWSLKQSTKYWTSCQWCLACDIYSWWWKYWLLHQTQLHNCSKWWQLVTVLLNSWAVNHLYYEKVSHSFLLHPLYLVLIVWIRIPVHFTISPFFVGLYIFVINNSLVISNIAFNWYGGNISRNASRRDQ